MSNQTKRVASIRRLVIIALFTAIAYIAMLMTNLIKVQFLTLDIKDAVITLSGLFFGPLAALFASVVVPLLELITVSSTGWYGLVMNFLGTASFSITVSLVYRVKKDLFGAILALVSGVFAMTVVMMFANLIITPIYTHMPTSAIRDMIPTLFLPFNLIKAVVNAAVVMMFYKPVSSMLQRTGFLPKSEHAFKLDKRTVIIMAVSLVLVVSSIAVIFNFLEGAAFEWGLLSKFQSKK